MAFFKFRKGADAAPAATAQPESVEALRRRARHRLIGAAVLVLLGIVGFPLLFDTQPRPIAVDIPIEIPDRAKAKPLPAPPQPQERAQGAVADATAPGATKTAAAPAPAKAPAPVAAAAPTPAPEPAKAAPAQQARTEPTPKPAEPSKPARESARAQAALEGKASATQADGRFIVQVGAFSDVGKAREARQRVERAGLKTYTQVAETRDGRRIRVRVGPFASRADADKAASRIKELDLPAAILTL